MSVKSRAREEVATRFRTLVTDYNVTPQQRGREFERLLHDLLKLEQLSPRTNFRPRGEEVDGSFEWHGRFNLLEAKWHSDPLPASLLYSFKGKVDGKLTGTIGVFISYSGYSKDAVNALRVGKDTNLILFDGDDIAAVFEGHLTFRSAFRRKLRAAAEEGMPFYKLRGTRAGNRHQAALSVLAIVEGRGEALLVHHLAQIFSPEIKLDIREAGGSRNILPTAQAVLAEQRAERFERLILIFDEDTASGVLNQVLSPGYAETFPEGVKVFTVVLPASELEEETAVMFARRFHSDTRQGLDDRLRGAVRRHRALRILLTALDSEYHAEEDGSAFGMPAWTNSER